MSEAKRFLEVLEGLERKIKPKEVVVENYSQELLREDMDFADMPPMTMHPQHKERSAPQAKPGGMSMIKPQGREPASTNFYTLLSPQEMEDLVNYYNGDWRVLLDNDIVREYIQTIDGPDTTTIEPVYDPTKHYADSSNQPMYTRRELDPDDFRRELDPGYDDDIGDEINLRRHGDPRRADSLYDPDLDVRGFDPDLDVRGSRRRR